LRPRLVYYWLTRVLGLALARNYATTGGIVTATIIKGYTSSSVNIKWPKEPGLTCQEAKAK